MKWRHRYHKVKHSLGQAYNTSMKILSVADRTHALSGKLFTTFGDQLDPDMQYKMAHGLDTYAKHSRTINTLTRIYETLESICNTNFRSTYKCQLIGSMWIQETERAVLLKTLSSNCLTRCPSGRRA